MKTDEWPFEYFMLDEFTCKCGCGENRIEWELVHKLEMIRQTYYRGPLAVSSGYRCPAHDAAVNGKGNHSTGFAADVIVPKGAMLMDFALACGAVNLPRVIVYHALPHVHVDMVPGRAPGLYVL